MTKTINTKRAPDAHERVEGTPRHRRVMFEVEGQPIPKARPRVVVGRGGRSRAFTPKATRDWEQQVGWAALAAGVRQAEGDVALDLTFRRKGRRRADLDNMIKACLDGLNGIAYSDDYQVVALSASVQYNCKRPGVTIKIRRIGWPGINTQ